MTKRIKLLGGEYTETSGEKYIVRRGSSVILSRAAYVELISFNPEFRPAPSDHEDFRTDIDDEYGGKIRSGQHGRGTAPARQEYGTKRDGGFDEASGHDRRADWSWMFGESSELQSWVLR